MVPILIILAVISGVSAIAYVGWRNDPRQQARRQAKQWFAETLKQIRRLPEHKDRERV